MPRVLITTVPFARANKLPLELMQSAGIDYEINPLNRKLREHELRELIGGYDAVIAGTEQITDTVFENADRLKLISRVGIGLDGVDLIAAKRRQIQVCYTPDAPAPAVSELTIGLMLTLLRKVHIANGGMHNRVWSRHFGRRISEVTIGIIGYGRIGQGVLERLSSFSPGKVLVNDINNSLLSSTSISVESATKTEIYENADVISLHLPLTAKTRGLIGYRELKSMKTDAVLLNTSRGGIIDEDKLAQIMNEGHLSAAAIDVFESEPYDGPLCDIDRCLLTCHMGSMSNDCREKMEIEATEEVVRFFNRERLMNPVPDELYEIM